MLSKIAIKEIALQVKEARERNSRRVELKKALVKMGVKFVVFGDSDVPLVSDEKPSVEELTAKVLCELRTQTALLNGIKSAIENSASEVYLDDLLKGQDSTNKQLEELVQAAERIANNTAKKE